MAHQWWGIGVQPTADRDRWLSEGFSDFAGLWYMQVILRDNEKYFKQLDEWRKSIRAVRKDAGPMGIGTRVGEVDGDYYSLIVYKKGAWVLHMLRNLMLNFRTMNEDVFTETMRDFYQTYRGRRASTADFQGVVEKHTGLGMDWFFRQWVDGTASPTYTMSWHAEPTAGGKSRLRFRVRQEGVPEDFIMPVPLQIELADGARLVVRVHVKGTVTEGELELPSEPKLLELNPLQSVLAEIKTEGWK
ncbi:MAG: M1 family aminopeptidase [Gemmatimonadota bacterium]